MGSKIQRRPLRLKKRKMRVNRNTRVNGNTRLEKKGRIRRRILNLRQPLRMVSICSSLYHELREFAVVGGLHALLDYFNMFIPEEDVEFDELGM